MVRQSAGLHARVLSELPVGGSTILAQEEVEDVPVHQCFCHRGWTLYDGFVVLECSAIVARDEF